MDACEQIVDLCWLPCGRYGACLGDEYRVVRQPAYSGDSRSEQRSELPVWFEIIAVDSRPSSRRSRRATMAPG